ncbi:MAG: hypothetical protein GY847_36015 [Proteobacteria bacterium]|nr:hypothetical protein [Pseudomonadota bacterium]
MTVNKRLLVVGLIMVFVLSGCLDTNGYGSATLGVDVSALSVDDISAIQVTVSGAHISPDIVSDLTKDPVTGDWSGVIDDIPAGDGRTFLAEASNASAQVIYSGSVTGVTITDGEQSVVTIFLQQVTPPDPFINSVPRFDSLVLSTNQVAPGNDVSLAVVASDPDPADTITLLWEATGGSFDTTDTANVIWAAPGTAGLYTLTVSASDPSGATAQLTMIIDVQIHYGNGSALVEIDINTWPVVAGLVPSPTSIDVGETTLLELTASDPDGDTLAYAWSADCTGTFSSTAVEDPSFTLDVDNSDADCTLTVIITDGRGGSNTASVVIQTGVDIVITEGYLAGDLMWLGSVEGNADVSPIDIASFPDDSFVVTGEFTGTATFGKGQAGETTFSSAGHTDVFMAKYSSDGTIIWAKRAGGVNGFEHNHGVSILSDGSVILTGYFYSSTAIFGEGAGAITLTKSAGYDCFIAKYDAAGGIVWVKQIKGTHNSHIFEVDVISDGSSFVSGAYAETAIFGEGEANQTQMTSIAGADSFVARYAPNGDVAWVKHVACAGDIHANYITVMPDGTSITVGHFTGTATFALGEANELSLVSMGSNDVFIAKYGPNGDFIWAKRAGGVDSDIGHAVRVFPDGNFVVMGPYGYTATFGLGEANEATILQKGGYDVFIAKYNQDGQLLWVTSAGGNSHDIARGMSITSDNSIQITGYFGSWMTFGEGEVNEETIYTGGGNDTFIAKFDGNGNFVWVQQGTSIIEIGGRELATLSDDSVVGVGDFQGTATFGVGELNKDSVVSTGNYNSFIARLYGEDVQP